MKKFNLRSRFLLSLLRFPYNSELRSWFANNNNVKLYTEQIEAEWKTVIFDYSRETANQRVFFITLLSGALLWIVILMTVFSYISKRKDETISSQADTLLAADKFKNTLAKITKSPAISSGNLRDAADIIAEEGCRALGTHRIGIWNITDDTMTLKNITYFDSSTGEHTVQEDVDLSRARKYVSSMLTERLIVINDIRQPNVLSEIIDGYDPNICTILDAPILVDGKLAGVISIEQDCCKEFQEHREWSIQEQAFASSLADIMTIAFAGFERRDLMRKTEAMMHNLPSMVYQCLNDPPNFKIQYLGDVIRKDNIIVINRDGRKSGIIRDFYISEERGKKELVIYGRTGSGLTERRLCVPPAEQQSPGALGWDKIRANAETVIKHYATMNLVTPYDSKRKISHHL